ncbi:hypothetical protein B0H13DRAFT_1926028 [Mycena leptocephala]|nr:hypothetical protein B0H13DRAFT_1926028 [Mycena leptocephala]
MSSRSSPLRLSHVPTNRPFGGNGQGNPPWLSGRPVQFSRVQSAQNPPFHSAKRTTISAHRKPKFNRVHLDICSGVRWWCTMQHSRTGELATLVTLKTRGELGSPVSRKLDNARIVDQRGRPQPACRMISSRKILSEAGKDIECRRAARSLILQFSWIEPPFLVGNVEKLHMPRSAAKVHPQGLIVSSKSSHLVPMTPTRRMMRERRESGDFGDFGKASQPRHLRDNSQPAHGSQGAK